MFTFYWCSWWHNATNPTVKNLLQYTSIISWGNVFHIFCHLLEWCLRIKEIQKSWEKFSSSPSKNKLMNGTTKNNSANWLNMSSWNFCYVQTTVLSSKSLQAYILLNTFSVKWKRITRNDRKISSIWNLLNIIIEKLPFNFASSPIMLLLSNIVTKLNKSLNWS